ncbi:Nn.00g065990.m01.CDS01 [Neocucurbitaria sp. VM-36]
MKDPAEKQGEGNDKAEPPTLSAIPGMNDLLEDNTHLGVQPEQSKGEEKAGEGESKVKDDNDKSHTSSAKSGAEAPVDPALSHRLLDVTVPGREATESKEKVADSNDHSVASSTGAGADLTYPGKPRKTFKNKNEDKAYEDEHDDKSDDEDEAKSSVVSTSYASTVSNKAFLNLRSITYLRLARWSTRKPQYESVIEVLLDDNQDDLIPPPPPSKLAVKSSTEQKVGDEKAPKTPKVDKNYGFLSPSWSKVKALQLMIHSPDLIANLKDIDLKVNWDNATLRGRVIFIRPFKFLVLREAEIRERFKELETYRSNFAEPPPPPPSPPLPPIIPSLPLPPSPDEPNEFVIDTHPSAPSSRSISPRPLYQLPSPLPSEALVIRSPQSMPPPHLPLQSPDAKEVENGSHSHEVKDISYDLKGMDEDLGSSETSKAKEEKQSTIFGAPETMLESSSDLDHHDIFNTARLGDPTGPRQTVAGSTKTSLPEVPGTIVVDDDDDDDAEGKLAKLEKLTLTQQNEQLKRKATAEAAAKSVEVAQKAREDAEAKATVETEEVKAAHERALSEAMHAATELEKARKMAVEEAAKLRPDAPKPPIKFKDAVGRKFSFPWHICKTWKGMEELIKQAFLHVDTIGPHVQEGHYDLVAPDGEIILPQVWETMVQPDWAVTMHMWPMSEPPPPDADLTATQIVRDSHTALEDFRLLIRFMDEDMKELFEMRQGIEDGTLKTIAFDDLWHLFHYGEEVILEDRSSGGKLRAARVFKFTGGRNTNADSTANPGKTKKIGVEALGPGSWGQAFVVQYWSLTYDGSLYWPQQGVMGIRPYEGEKEISSLPIYPSKFDRSGKIKQLVEVGNIFKQFTTELYSHRKYLGKNYDTNSRGEGIDSEVIIDFREALSTEGNAYARLDSSLPEENQIDHDNRETWVEYPEHGLCSQKGWCIREVAGPDFSLDNLELGVFLRNNKHMVHAKESIDDSEITLLPDQVPGYVLNRKYWAILSTNRNNLMEFQGTSDPWNDLVLEEKQKVIVEALVAKHLHHPHENNEIDMPYQLGGFTAGKGRSIVLLLHGPPGVGKTSTAECIAAHMSKPLYPLTSGNLPVRANDLEEQLQVHFTLAARWGCILLLDEADVFLQRRRLNELEINAMVSVFLRQLEYYQGILFLTTNRVGDIDPAFKSRIHVSLEYEPLDRRRSKKIYKLHLRRIKEALGMRRNAHGSNFKVNSEEILVWSDQHFKNASKRHRQWNGRQIHNAFQTAVALAEWEARTKNPKNPHSSSSAHDNTLPELVLGKKHFKQVAQVSEGFDQYMTDLMGGRNEAEVAAFSAQRYDYRPGKSGEPRKSGLSDSDSDDDSDSDSDSDGDGDLFGKRNDSDGESDAKQKKSKGKSKKKVFSSDNSLDGGAKKTASKRKGKRKDDTSEEKSSDEVPTKKSSRKDKNKDKKNGRSKRRDSDGDSY